MANRAAVAGSAAVPLCLGMAAVLLPFLVLGGAGAVTPGPNPAAMCAGQASGQTFGTVTLDDAQLSTASTIISVTARRKLPVTAAVVAVTAAYTDSSLRNTPPSGEALTAGIFAQPIATYTQPVATDPLAATGAFLDRLINVPNWQTMTRGAAAQSVQQSKLPERYQPNAGLAEQVVSEFWASTTAAADPAAPDPEGDDAGSLNINASQMANARYIIAAAKTLKLPQQAAAIGIMTAQQESTLRVLSNPTVPGSENYPNQGSGSDADSIGLFQQRPSMEWGTVEQLMDPGYASTKFLQGLMTVPNWQTLPRWQAAQEVQRSANGALYAQRESFGSQVAAALWTGTTDSLICTSTPIGTTVGGPGGAFAPEACSVVPDPTTGRGCLTPRTLNIATQLVAQSWRLGCWDPHPNNPRSDHPLGLACDIYPGRAGVLPSAQEKASGDALAASLQASAPQTGLNYIIWSGQIWSVSRAAEGWRPYKSSVYDETDVVGGHFDHLHVSVY